MVIYVKDLWVLESNTDGMEISSDKEYVVYNPETKKVLFENNDMLKCVKKAEVF